MSRASPELANAKRRVIKSQGGREGADVFGRQIQKNAHPLWPLRLGLPRRSILRDRGTCSLRSLMTKDICTCPGPLGIRKSPQHEHVAPKTVGPKPIYTWTDMITNTCTIELARFLADTRLEAGPVSHTTQTRIHPRAPAQGHNKDCRYSQAQ